MRSIVIPPQITLRSPETGETLIAISFEMILKRLMANPLWAETFKAMKSQLSIERAWEKGENPFVIAEEDWVNLKRAAEDPRMATGDHVVAGLGFYPQLSSQLVPYLAAIIDAAQV